MLGTNSQLRVAGVTPDTVLYTVKVKDEKTGKTVTEQRSIPSNFVLWSTGIAMNPFTQRVSNLLPNQFHKKAIETDAHLRVIGAPLGEVYAIGDCATIETSVVSHFMELVEACDTDKNGKIDFGEWELMGGFRVRVLIRQKLTISQVEKIKTRIPMAEKHLTKVKDLFQLYDTDADESLSLNELVKLLEELGNRITALPAVCDAARFETRN